MLIAEHMTFAEKGARAFARRYAVLSGFDFEDFLSAAHHGLVVAAKKFNPELGWKFTTFAFNYTNSFMLEVMQNDRRQDGWKHAPSKAERERGATGMQQVLKRTHAAPYNSDGEENELGFEALLPPVTEDPVKRMSNQALRDKLFSVCRNEQQRLVLTGMLNEEKDEWAGKQLGVSRQRIHQIRVVLMKKIQKRFHKEWAAL